jgi:hypothetical protein
MTANQFFKGAGATMIFIGMILSLLACTMYQDSESEDCEFTDYPCQHQQRKDAANAAATSQLALVMVFAGIGFILIKEEHKCPKKKK